MKYTTKRCSKCSEVLELTPEFFYRESKSSDGYRASCKKCYEKARVANKNKVKIEKPVIEGHKYCSKCEKSLPADEVHFYRASRNKDGFYSQCKKCKGGKFGITQPNSMWVAKEGYKFCSKCFKELPLDDEHFYKSSNQNDGRSTKCKVCTGIKEYGVRNKNKVYNFESGKKMCTICEKVLKVSSFHKMAISTDGLMSICKQCHKTRMKEYESRPEVKIRIAAYEKARSKVYYATPHGKAMAKKHMHIRKSRIAQAIYNYSAETWLETLEYFNDSCAYCGDKSDSLHQEHIIPLSKGGSYTKQNIIPACAFCNASKHNKDLMDWYPTRDNFDTKRLEKIKKWSGVKNNIQQLSIF